MTHSDHLKNRGRRLGGAVEAQRTVTLRISREKKRKAHEMALHFRISFSKLVEKLLDDYSN
jgi:hypothetical protein